MSLQLIEAARLLRFDPATGWPESLPLVHAFALQTWYEGIETKAWRSKAADLRKLFSLDHGKGAVKVTTWTETKTVEVRPTLFDRAFGETASWATYTGHRNETEGQRRDRLWHSAHPTVTQQRVVTHTHITAQAFATWLAAIEIEPNRHVATWLKAMGVNADRRPIEPPAEWKAQSPHGLQRIDITDAGRLVRLADLVQWLMDARELPCKAAVEEVCARLEQRPIAAASWLYLLTESDYARPLPADHSFFYVPGFDPCTPDATGQTNDRGLVGAIKYMRQFWGESRVPGAGNWIGQHVLDPLAIRVEVAHLLFGYGGHREEAEQSLSTIATTASAREKPAQRNKRWLAIWDEERRTGSKVGHQARAVRRIVQAESVTEATAKRGLQMAEKARAEEYREGKVGSIKRKSTKPASPFDVVTKRK